MSRSLAYESESSHVEKTLGDVAVISRGLSSTSSSALHQKTTDLEQGGDIDTVVPRRSRLRYVEYPYSSCRFSQKLVLGSFCANPRRSSLAFSF